MNCEELRHRQDEHHLAILKQYLPSKMESAISADGAGFRFVVQHEKTGFWHQWTPAGCIPVPKDLCDIYNNAQWRNPNERTEDDTALLAMFCGTPMTPIYCRAMLPNEVLFESDIEDYKVQRVVANRILGACRSCGWEPLICWTGGKSIHLDLWLDMATVELGPLLEKRIDQVSASMPDGFLRTMIPRLVRLEIFEEVLRKAELDDTQLLDEAVVKYQTRRMVRALGARHIKTRQFKVFLPTLPMERPDASEPAFPEHLPPPADLSKVAAAVRARIIIELDRLTRSQRRQSSHESSAVEPCPRVRQGERNITLFHWSLQQASHRVPIEDALKEQENWTQDVGGRQLDDRTVVERAYRYIAGKTPTHTEEHK